MHVVLPFFFRQGSSETKSIHYNGRVFNHVFMSSRYKRIPQSMTGGNERSKGGSTGIMAHSSCAKMEGKPINILVGRSLLAFSSWFLRREFQDNQLTLPPHTHLFSSSPIDPAAGTRGSTQSRVSFLFFFFFAKKGNGVPSCEGCRGEQNLYHNLHPEDIGLHRESSVCVHWIPSREKILGFQGLLRRRQDRSAYRKRNERERLIRGRGFFFLFLPTLSFFNTLELRVTCRRKFLVICSCFKELGVTMSYKEREKNG